MQGVAALSFRTEITFSSLSQKVALPFISERPIVIWTVKVPLVHVFSRILAVFSTQVRL